LAIGGQLIRRTVVFGLTRQIDIGGPVALLVFEGAEASTMKRALLGL